MYFFRLLTLKLQDIEIGRLGFGTIHLTTGRGFGAALQNAEELLQTLVRLGVNFFDTADSYGPGTAENLIRKAPYPYKNMVIVTKGGYEHPAEDDRPAHLRAALEGNLKRLGVDRRQEWGRVLNLELMLASKWFH